MQLLNDLLEGRIKDETNFNNFNQFWSVLNEYIDFRNVHENQLF